MQNFLQNVQTENDSEKTAASVLDRTGDGAPDPQDCKGEKVEEFTETAQLGEYGECEERLVSKQQIITEPVTEPAQETHVLSDCKEQEHGRELMPLDIPDFLLPDAPEDENGGWHAICSICGNVGMSLEKRSH